MNLNNIEKIIFYNHFHNGDIHLSRNFVKFIINQVKFINKNIQFFYYHPNHPYLLDDIKGLSHIGFVDKDQWQDYGIDGNVIYINTWYAIKHFEYMNKYGMTFDCLYSVFDQVCKNIFEFSLPQNIESLFPSIDYSKFEIDKAKQFVDSATHPLVLICNGQALSGQATNFSLGNSILSLANKYHGISFILTNKEDLPEKGNIFYSSDIIGKNSCDLNENSYLSTYCDLIVVRSSGVHTFALVQENLFKRSIPIISFSNLSYPQGSFWLGELFKDKVIYKSNIVNYDIGDAEIASKIIELYLLEICNGK